jgi:hypothetical protein
LDCIAHCLNWLNQEHQHYENYHNHKEMMAWVATAFYTPSVITLGFVVTELTLVTAVLLTVGLTATVYLVLVFINMQFRKRWWASDATAILVRLIVKISCNSDNPKYLPKIKSLFWKLDNKDFDEHFLPLFIEKSIDKLWRKRRFWLALREILLLKLVTLDDRWKTEIPSYIIVFLATITAILSIWRGMIF